MSAKIYGFSAKNHKGEIVPMSHYQGKVIVIVNTASECGFTHQYEGLQSLYEKHKEKGLEILGFPCNQFGGQEPGTDQEVQSFCTGRFGVTFPVLAKIDVNGPDADPLFQYLKSEAKGVLGTQAIKWNFTKFLVDRKGNVVDRFAPQTKPEDLEKEILKLLDAPTPK